MRCGIKMETKSCAIGAFGYMDVLTVILVSSYIWNAARTSDLRRFWIALEEQLQYLAGQVALEGTWEQKTTGLR